MKIFGWRADDAGCGWWRVTVPFATLAKRGHQVGHSVTYTSEWDSADVIVGQRVCMPSPSKRWREWADQGRRLVYDVDDDWWNVELTAPNGMFWQSREVRARIRENVAMATRVTTCSNRLAEIMSAFHRDVRVVPNGLPREVLSWPPPVAGERVLVGWSGTDSTIAELPLAARHLRKLLDRQPNVDVHTIGVPGPLVAKAGLRHERVTNYGPRAKPGEYLRAIDWQVWAAPYRNTPFNRAKAATKFLEASALGIPIVASRMGSYADSIVHGETGFLVSADHEWDTYLRMLVEDADLRTEMGRRARQHAAQFTAEEIAPLWEEALAP
ncbi:hypothetical protein Aph01nite_43930 [Acrocarpospora phusangensis]|uniref:Glycosyl transferase family 1 domain-containing protein n=1 Tax=Acrocarpospora phusangensis TaxID=1070424 RepID=A0A919QEM3_9ACTN|nr:glycosyltransferase family 4 protein [Acrocarpospora phusangensis]GIH26083.1 hypothetical protein Aph01nite_43930 [Acrocarpospora phusangensis]